MKASTKAIRFLESLSIPEGPKACQKVKLAPFQKQFVKGALADGVNVAVLSIGRGNAKTELSAGIAFDFVVGFIGSLPVDEQAAFMIRRSPRLEVEYDGDGRGHFIRAIAADGKTALGSTPTLVPMDERGRWLRIRGTLWNTPCCLVWAPIVVRTPSTGLMGYSDFERWSEAPAIARASRE